ncbi:urease accessory protein UreH domain-containing protein [Alteribacter natronophilus]|uniref:urease accessory protein UreH domain-containing protein n=1 Tax=Alteribacter natronophilus TaxID=2583810 RepID=UPI00110F1270|nr:sulfite exporter TauE/SafE family protein [Alteribacter natronophilus]TMW70273.1 sulfite exporter TauE/SafE family protein [Alteribacter natronophilus]
MFELAEAFSQWLRSPFMNAAESAESWPVLFALLLGLVGALAPCQLSGNLSAITLYGTRSLKNGVSWREAAFYTVGKIAAFMLAGGIVWLIGQEFQQQLTLYFPWFRRLLGPLLIVIGLYMMGLFTMRWTMRLWKNRREVRGGSWGAFMLGFTFSLGFCPTMFLLFFMLLMPAAFTSSAGIVLPAVFAVGTAVPFLIVIGLISYLGAGGVVMKKSRKLGLIVQRTAGAVMIVIGVLDILTFW